MLKGINGWQSVLRNSSRGFKFNGANKGAIIKLIESVKTVRSYNGPGSHVVMLSKEMIKNG